MYSIIRKLHLFASFFLATFILMYFVTGFVMIFEQYFKREHNDMNIKEAMVHTRPLNADDIVARLQSQFKLRGQYSVRFQDQRAVVNFRHPGEMTEVIVPYETDSVFISKRKGNIYFTMHQFHRLHGFYGGLNYVVWSLVYDLSALSMIVFALSGFYLWYKSERYKGSGWIVFAVSTFITFGTIIYLMFLA